MDADHDLELTGRETCYDGFFRLDRFHLRHRRFDGSWTPVLDREVVLRRPAVAVLPYDPDLDRVVLLEQFRPAAYAAGRPAWMTEIPAGLVEFGEALPAVAAREVKEETGLAVEALEPVAEFMPSPGGFAEVVTLFVGRVDASNAGGIFGVDAEHEDIRSFTMDAAEALALMAVPGRIDNAIALIAFQWLALNREALRRRWRSSGRQSPGHGS
jgi:ADP-ribose pyrophosphatase